MIEPQNHAAREREEITGRLAHFKATQQKFQHAREEYYAATLGNAWSGFGRTVPGEFEDPPFWS